MEKKETRESKGTPQQKLRKWVLLSLVAVLGVTGAQEVSAEEKKDLTRQEVEIGLRTSAFGEERRNYALENCKILKETKRCIHFTFKGVRIFRHCESDSDGEEYYQKILIRLPGDKMKVSYEMDNDGDGVPEKKWSDVVNWE